MTQSVLITGINGFVGRHLVKLLKSNNYTISGIGINEMAVEGINYYNLDLLKKNEILLNIMNECDKVVHLAAILPHNQNKGNFLNVNLNITNNVLESFEKSNAKTFIFLSSMKVYGKLENIPSDENVELNPKTDYGKSKLACENLIKKFSSKSNKKFIILRSTYLFGPNQNKDFLIPAILDQVKLSNKVILQNANLERDYIYVKDLCQAIMNSLKCDFKELEVFNISSSKLVSINYFVKYIANLLNKKVEIIDKHINKGENKLESFDNKKAKKMLNWELSYTIEEGLREIIKNKT